MPTSTLAIYPPVAQLDNAADSDSEERGFKSLRAGQTVPLARQKEERIENKYEMINMCCGAVCFIIYSIFFFLYSLKQGVKNER